ENTGLTGGGTAGALCLAVNYGTTAGTAVEGNKSMAINTAADSGLSGGSSITLGAGGSVTLTNTDRGSSQSIFKNIANGSGQTQFSAGLNNDAIRFAGGGGTTVSFDAVNKKVTIDGSSSNIPAANVSAGTFAAGTYTIPGA